MKALVMLLVVVSVASSVAAQTGGRNDSSPVIVQMSYYAQPGMEDEVLRLRLLAAEMLVKRGLNRGKVWRSTTSPRRHASLALRSSGRANSRMKRC